MKGLTVVRVGRSYVARDLAVWQVGTELALHVWPNWVGDMFLESSRSSPHLQIGTCWGIVGTLLLVFSMHIANSNALRLSQPNPLALCQATQLGCPQIDSFTQMDDVKGLGPRRDAKTWATLHQKFWHYCWQVGIQLSSILVATHTHPA